MLCAFCSCGFQGGSASENPSPEAANTPNENTGAAVNSNNTANNSNNCNLVSNNQIEIEVDGPSSNNNLPL